MIGAAVLVVLLVVVAPALLDGRKDDGVAPRDEGPAIIETREEVAPVRIETIVLNGDSAAEPAASKPEPKPAPAPATGPKAEPKTESGSAPAPKPAPVDGWMVQLGSFSAVANARSFADQLKEKGFAAVVTSFRSGNKTMYRVQVGPKESREAAEKLAAQLKKAGHNGIVVSVKK